jgi:hypothetical protein
MNLPSWDQSHGMLSNPFDTIVSIAPVPSAGIAKRSLRLGKLPKKRIRRLSGDQTGDDSLRGSNVSRVATPRSRSRTQMSPLSLSASL